MEAENVILTWDLAVASAIFLAFILYAAGNKRSHIVQLTVSIYGGYALLQWFPFTNSISQALNIHADIADLGMFAIFIVLLYYIFSGAGARDILPKLRFRKADFWQKLFVSIGLAGFLSSIVLAQLFSVFAGDFSEIVKQGFLRTTPAFLWSLAPLLVILLTRKKPGKERE